jgi:hypothetical protein
MIFMIFKPAAGVKLTHFASYVSFSFQPQEALHEALDEEECECSHHRH